MEIGVVAVLAILMCLCKASSSQDTIISYFTSSVVRLPCSIASRDNAVWSEEVGNATSITLLSYDIDDDGDGVTRDAPAGGKYDNFHYDRSVPTEFDLIIRDVEKNDGGEYLCITFTPLTRTTYTLIVEVTPSSVDINHNGNEVINVTESYNFTCTAVGVRSPNILNIIWSTNNIREVVVPERSKSQQGSDLQDLTSTFELSPQKDDTSLNCSISGYVNQDEINEDVIMHTLQLTVQYAPICTLEFGEGEVGESGCTVMLICNCDANPDVTAGGYSYFKDNILIVDGGDDTATGDVKLDTPTEFSCRGRNIVGSGEQSPAVEYKSCSSPPTTSPPTPTVSTTVTTPLTEITSTTPGSPNVLAFVLPICIVVIVGIAVGGYLGYRFSKKREEGGGKNDNTGGNGVNAKLAEEQPEYAAVNKPTRSEPQAAPRSSKPPDNEEKMELQYADIDHGNRGRTNEIHQPADEPTTYAEVKSVIV